MLYSATSTGVAPTPAVLDRPVRCRPSGRRPGGPATPRPQAISSSSRSRRPGGRTAARLAASQRADLGRERRFLGGERRSIRGPRTVRGRRRRSARERRPRRRGERPVASSPRSRTHNASSPRDRPELLLGEGAVHDLVRAGGRQLAQRPGYSAAATSARCRPVRRSSDANSAGSNVAPRRSTSAAITWSPASASGTP